MLLKERSIEKKKLIYICILVILILTVGRLNPPEGLSKEGWRAILCMICAIFTFVTEIIPIGAASCLFIFMPELFSIGSTQSMMDNFAVSPIFFIIAASIIAEVFISVGLGQRISFYVGTLFGSRSEYVLLSFMLSTALLSGFLADIPTSIIFSNIAAKLLEENNCQKGRSNLGKSMMMGIPIAACIGGFATPIGSGINILCLNLIHQLLKIKVSFFQWSAIGIPMAVILTFVSWFLLIFFLKPEIKTIKGLEHFKVKQKNLGHFRREEKIFTVIFLITLLLWFTQNFTGLDLTLTAVICAAVFFLPFIRLIEWKRAQSVINWSGILLIGCTNAFTQMLIQTGSMDWMGSKIVGQIQSKTLIPILLAATCFGLFIHFLIPIGNAVVSFGTPLLCILAERTGVNPIYLILILGFTSKCVFLLPLDPIPLTTYGYGYWKLLDMTKIGVVIAVFWIPIMVIFMLCAIKIGII